MKKKCDKCYIEIKEKKYTIFRGIIFSIFIQIFLMIPILGFSLLKSFYEDGYDNHKEGEQKDFWKDCFYNIKTKQIKVKEAKQCKT